MKEYSYLHDQTSTSNTDLSEWVRFFEQTKNKSPLKQKAKTSKKITITVSYCYEFIGILKQAIYVSSNWKFLLKTCCYQSRMISVKNILPPLRLSSDIYLVAETQ